MKFVVREFLSPEGETLAECEAAVRDMSMVNAHGDAIMMIDLDDRNTVMITVRKGTTVEVDKYGIQLSHFGED